MSESTHEERVQESGVVGHSYDTDDRIGDLDIYEALVNPHEEGAGQKKGGAGGPMMMPMGGAGAGSGSSAGSSTAAGTAGSGALKGTSAASAGTGGASGFSGTTGAGVGGIGGTGFGGGSGLGTDALAGVGGAGGGLSGLSGLGTGGGAGGLSGSSWGSPSFGTGAAGLTDPTNLPGTDPGSTTGGITLPTVPTTPTPTIPTPTIPTTSPGGSTSPIKMPSTPTPSASGIKAPSAGGLGGGMPSGGGGAAGANTSDLGVKTVKASPEMLHKEAQHWDDTSKEFAANVTNPIGNQSPSSVDFGMMKDAFPSYNDLLTRLKKWSTEAGSEFSAISEALQSASGGYSDTEATNTATAAHTGSSRPE